MRPQSLPLFLALCSCAYAVNFPFESDQLKDADIGSFSAISFGDTIAAKSTSNKKDCRALPGTEDWPIAEEWSKLNVSLGGALLQPSPLAAACYPGPLKDESKCKFVLGGAGRERVFIDDPLTIFTEWPLGDTCYATANPQMNCTQGGFPSYVVNVTTVRQIQLAVNFARNRNIRLIIKNTGHEFFGRSTGAGSLSIWTHYLKGFEYLPEYTQGEYKGRASRVGAGLESWEMFRFMDQYNMTVVVPGSDSTVGAYGGWMQGGGHSTLGSKYGLGSDQPLSLQVVTASGRFVTADPDTNEDLYYALRGGGPSTFGIVTSAVIKAYPHLEVPRSVLAFSSGTPPNTPNNASTYISDIETFWRGVSTYQYFGKNLTEAGGTGYSNIISTSTGSLTFATNIEMAGRSKAELSTFLQPLIDSLNALGIPVRRGDPITSLGWGPNRQGKGDVPGRSTFSSRLFPRAIWDNEAQFKKSEAAIRASVEAGYRFRGIHILPNAKAAGHPLSAGTDSGVNPAFRTAIMHADSFDSFSSALGQSAASFKETRGRHNVYMDKIREATPGGGAYINEADVLEPNWQQAFFGSKYQKLLEIKRDRDPWNLFWAPSTVGSEGWAVRGPEGIPTQNGPLCRTGR